MDRDHVTKNELLINWSKWLITINLFSATGCILGLKTAGDAKEATGVLFFLAVLFFLLSTICSTLFVFLLSRPVIQENDRQNYTWLATVQWILFTLGLVFVIGWIAFLSGVAG